MNPGEIYRHEAFYVDPTTGELKPKYLLILASSAATDAVAALLTSRVTGRIETPTCSHASPYPSYYLGVLGGRLGAKSWVDLRNLLDIDAIDFGATVKKGIAAQQMILSAATLAEVLDCAAAADDTTRSQEKRLRDALSALR